MIIRNYDKLINVRAESLNENVASASISYGNVDVDPKKPGHVDILVTADNAKSVYISVTVTDLKKIDVPSKVDVYIDSINGIMIKNYKDLHDVKVSSADETIASAVITDNIIYITGKVVGDVKITVTAMEASDATILISVHEIKKIDVVSTTSVDLGKITSLKIKNFQDLTDVQVQSQNEQVAIAGIIGDEIMIKGLRVGKTKLTVSADHARNVNIDVTVNALKIIDVDQNVSVNVGEFVELKINNFVDLTNVVVKTNDAQVATTGILGDEVVIKGIALGETEVLVSADHALDALINVTVN
jgi:hypothetical protein